MLWQIEHSPGFMSVKPKHLPGNVVLSGPYGLARPRHDPDYLFIAICMSCSTNAVGKAHQKTQLQQNKHHTVVNSRDHSVSDIDVTDLVNN